MLGQSKRRWLWWIAGAVAAIIALWVAFLLVIGHAMTQENNDPSAQTQMALAAQSVDRGSAIYWLGDDPNYNDFAGDGFSVQTDGWQASTVPPAASTNTCVRHAVDLPHNRWAEVLVATYLHPASTPRSVPPYCRGGLAWTVESTTRKPNGEVVVIAFDQYHQTTPSADEAAADALATHLQPFPGRG
jgi:hypothetical protein